MTGRTFVVAVNAGFSMEIIKDKRDQKKCKKEDKI